MPSADFCRVSRMTLGVFMVHRLFGLIGRRTTVQQFDIISEAIRGHLYFPFAPEATSEGIQFTFALLNSVSW